MIIKFLIKKSANSYFYFIAAIFSAILLAASLTFLFGEYNDFRSTASYEIRAQNNNINRKITDSLIYTKQIMTYVGRQISTHNPRDYKFINDLLINYRVPSDGLLHWNIFAWVDEKHKVKVSSGLGILDENIDLSDRNYLILARENPLTMHIGNPIIGRISKIHSIPIGYGITNNHREYVGSVIAGISVNNLKSQISSLISGDNVLFAITDGNGEVVIKSENLDSGENKVILEKMLENIKDPSRRELISDFAYFKQLFECDLIEECVSYGLITIYDNNTAERRHTMRLMTYSLIASFLIAIVGFVLFGFYEHIIRPIAILSETAQKICRNESNRQIPKFEIDELNQLANSLSEIDKALNKK